MGIERKMNRDELEDAILEFFKMADPETRIRIFQNLLFSISFEHLKTIALAEKIKS